jgi:hypothetical protein
VDKIIKGGVNAMTFKIFFITVLVMFSSLLFSEPLPRQSFNNLFALMAERGGEPIKKGDVINVPGGVLAAIERQNVNRNVIRYLAQIPGSAGRVICIITKRPLYVLPGDGGDWIIMESMQLKCVNTMSYTTDLQVVHSWVFEAQL